MACLSFLHVYYILVSINSISGSHVVVAGNEDAFRNLANRMAPQKLFNRLASYVQSAQAPVYEENDYGNPNEGAQNEPAYDNREYGNAYANAAENPVVNPVMNPVVNPVMNPVMNPDMNPVMNPADNPAEYPAIAPIETPDEIPVQDYVQQTTRFFRVVNPVTKKLHPVQVNLDELVEKVKDRLMQELKTRQTSISKPRLKASNRPKPPSRPVAVPRPVPQNLQQAAPPAEYEEASSVSPIIQSAPPPVSKKVRPPPLVNGPQSQNKKRKPAGVLVEKADLYDKIKLTKHKGHKDSYEDYVIPKKDDIFETEEVDGKIVKREFSKEAPGALGEEQKSVKVKVKRKEVQQVDETTNATNNKPKRLKAATPNEDSKNKATSTAPSSKIEYVDDDYYTKASTTEHVPKAMTEFIGDSKEDQEAVVVETTSEPGRGRKKVPKKIVTNMPTRARFTMCTPNYYEKLPRIAEKYNFDEPIPERDREEEDLKAFPNPEANINGKVKV